MKIVCGWCKKHMKGDPNDPVVSHGICSPCFYKSINDEVDRLYDQHGISPDPVDPESPAVEKPEGGKP